MVAAPSHRKAAGQQPEAMMFDEREDRCLCDCPNEPRVFGVDGYLQLDHSIIRQATILEDKAVAQGVLRFGNHFQELHAETEDIGPSACLPLRK
jgi:hypothetical protein